MTEAPRISIALCTYNGAKFLPQQLDSLLAQSMLPDEVIIRDDASTDDEATWRVLERYEPKFQAKNVNIELIRGFDNVGYLRNFEIVLGKCTGDVIFLCDQDDVWHPTKIERMYREFSQRPNLGVLFTDARLVDSKGDDLGFGLFEAVRMDTSQLNATHRGNIAEILMQHTVVTGATTAVKREALQAALPFPRGWVHDEWLAFVTALQNDYVVDAVEEKLIDYRQHDENAIGMKRPEAANFWTANGKRRSSQRTLALRLQSLLNDSKRLQNIDPKWVHELEQRRIHAHHRGHLPNNPVNRTWLVFREILTGRYGRYAQGFRSIVSDLAKLS